MESGIVRILKEKENDLLSKLPFDQYSRQKIVSYLIDESFRKKQKNKRLKIIDVGGYNGKTVEFQPIDDVTVLDVFDKKIKNYVKGTALNMQFQNNEFDIVCSFDVFEHIPRDKRKAFINEALRVSRLGVFLSIPVDINNKVSSAEILLNDFYVELTGKDHKWLKEHIDYKIPNDFEIRKLIKQSGASMVELPSNQLGDWQMMQMLLFMSSTINDITGEVNNINTWYNKNTLYLDSAVDVGYRKIIFISKNKEHTDTVGEVIRKLKRTNSNQVLMTVNKKTFIEFTRTLSLVSRKYYQLSENYRLRTPKAKKELIEEIDNLRKDLKEIEKKNNILKKELRNIYDSKSWRLIHKLRHIKDAFKPLKDIHDKE